MCLLIHSSFIMGLSIHAHLTQVHQRLPFFFLNNNNNNNNDSAEASAKWKIGDRSSEAVLVVMWWTMMFIRSKWNLCDNFRVYGAVLYSNEALHSSSEVNSLYRCLSRAGDPRISMTDVLDQWVGEGRDVKLFELQRFIRDLRKFRC